MTKSLLALLAALLVLSAPAVSPIALSPVAHAQADAAKITVYVTKTGERYHRDGCQHLSRSKIPTSLKDAIQRGYTPCKVCKPPIR